MRITSITRQSGLLATSLLLLTVVAEHLRMMSATPHAMEVVGCVSSPSWGKSVAAIIILVITGILVGRTATKSGIFRNFCTLPIPIFGVAGCGMFVSPDMFATSATAMCAAGGMSLFIRTLSRPNDKNPVFFGAMLFGITVLLYPPCIVFAALLPFMALVSFQSWRKIVIAAVGYLLPFAAYSYIGWYAGDSILGGAYSIAEWFVPFGYAPMHSPAREGFPIMPAAIAVILLSLVVAGAVLRRIDKGTTLVKADKSAQIVSAVMILSVAAFAVPQCTVAIMPVIAVPTAILAAATLDRIKTETSTIIYWILLLLTATHLFFI